MEKKKEANGKEKIKNHEEREEERIHLEKNLFTCHSHIFKFKKSFSMLWFMMKEEKLNEC